MHSEARGGAYLALHIGSYRKIGASDGRARLSCTAEGSAQTYSIYGLYGRGQPVGPVTALSSDGGGIAADRAAARPVQVLLCPGSYLEF